jgi:hypothetical protein
MGTGSGNRPNDNNRCIGRQPELLELYRYHSTPPFRNSGRSVFKAADLVAGPLRAAGWVPRNHTMNRPFAPLLGIGGTNAQTVTKLLDQTLQPLEKFFQAGPTILRPPSKNEKFRKHLLHEREPSVVVSSDAPFSRASTRRKPSSNRSIVRVMSSRPPWNAGFFGPSTASLARLLTPTRSGRCKVSRLLMMPLRAEQEPAQVRGFPPRLKRNALFIEVPEKVKRFDAHVGTRCSARLSSSSSSPPVGVDDAVNVGLGVDTTRWTK